MTRSAARLLSASAVLAALVGCSAGEAPPASGGQPATPPTISPLGPRPVILRLDAVDACRLLGTAEESRFKLGAGIPSEDDDGTGNRVCLWDTDPPRAAKGLVARLTFNHGAEWYRDSLTGAEVVQVAGFSAVQTSSDIGDPNTQCTVAVDVAPGQNLTVQYADRETPGMTHETACHLARQVADPMIGNLRSLAR